MTASPINRLGAAVDLRIPGFEKTVPSGRVRQLVFRDRDVRDWFGDFVGRCCAAIGSHYLPIYRMSDGEFGFCVGFRFPYPEPGRNPVVHYAREIVSYLRWRRFNTSVSGAPENARETYRGSEWRDLRKCYAEQLRDIARTGILALNFVKTPERFSEQYYGPMLRWFDSERIGLTEQNYYPFYFVYALLNGPARRRIYAHRRLLVITSLSRPKEQAIGDALRRAGAASVQFMSISDTGALRDRLDLSMITTPVDVVLIGAGVGSSNILGQVRDLATLSIDAGHCLDMLANPALAGSRDFTLPDDGDDNADRPLDDLSRAVKT
jgi:hypothetical protein